MSCGRVIDGICPGGSGGDAALTENIDGGDIGDIATQTAPATTGFTSPGAAGTVLTSNGPLTLPTYEDITVPFVPQTLTIYSSGSGTFTPTAGCKYIEVYMQAGGGAGGSGNSLPSCGGGGGGFAYLLLPPIAYSYSVGAGASAPSNPSSGGNGSNTTFGVYTVNGGGGGQAGTASAGSSGTGGGVNASVISDAIIYRVGGAGGTNHYDSVTSAARFGARGGSSYFSGNTWEPAFGNGAITGVYGAGGGGTNPNGAAANGGAGGSGLIRVIQYF